MRPPTVEAIAPSNLLSAAVGFAATTSERTGAFAEGFGKLVAAGGSAAAV